MRKLMIAIIALIAVLTILAIGLNLNQQSLLANYFSRMHSITV
jgi:hypothetical protein